MATPSSMLHIISQGLQDQERLNSSRGNPSIHFYTAVHHPRTRWASRWERIDFDGLADFGRSATATLPIKGELISRITLVVVLPDIKTPQIRAATAATNAGHELIGPHWSWTNSVGNAIASEISLTIDGQRIDTLDSRFLEILNEEETSIEHFESSCDMVLRNPMDYSEREYLRYRSLTPTVEIGIPFWFSRGPGSSVLPIQAMSKSKVQITCNFRTIQELIYTDARVDSRNPGKESSQSGPLPLISSAIFYETDETSPQRIYNQTRIPIIQGGEPTLEPFGRIISGVTMPSASQLHFEDAFFVVEYISVEDREASAFRLANLSLPILQHVALPSKPTEGTSIIRMPINQEGLVRDITLVAQREEATQFNAYFLFSKDLGDPSTVSVTETDWRHNCFIPWWANARIPNWDYGDGYVRPAFVNRQSDPISGMTMTYRGRIRFDHDGPSVFRSLIPSLNGIRKTPLINRYIYKYFFQDSEEETRTLNSHKNEYRGAANWDLLPKKELVIRMADTVCGNGTENNWITDTTQTEKEWIGSTLTEIDSVISPTTEGFRIRLQGGTPPGLSSGKSAFVEGIVDYQALRRIPGYIATRVRLNVNGSASLVVQTGVNQHIWIAVAGSGGFGTGVGQEGGNAGDAVQIGFTGGPSPTRSHIAPSSNFGGAGGGRLDEAGPGLPDGIQMPTTDAFVLSHSRTNFAMLGGDGYYGGGEGSLGGGGGGSYVSRWITSVHSAVDPTMGSIVSATLTPLVRSFSSSSSSSPPKFTLYSWLTTHNILQIVGGKAALLFT